MSIALIAGVILLLIALRAFASYAIEVEWWKELGQLETWFGMLTYSVAPLAGATLLAFAVLWITHSRALKFAGASLRDHSLYAKAAGLGLLVVSYFIAAASIDNWTVVRFAGSRGLQAAAAGATDAVFQKPLSLLSLRSTFLRVAAQLRDGAADRRDFAVLDRRTRVAIALSHAGTAWSTRTGRIIPAAGRRAGVALPEGLPESMLLLAFAWKFYLARYQMVYNEHGSFLVGVDWVDQNIGIPMQWVVIFACLAAAGLVWMGRFLWAAFLALALVADFVVPAVVSTLYVKPNEISIGASLYTDAHTRNSFGLPHRTGG